MNPKELISRLQKAFEINDEEFIALKASKTRNPFEVLVATVLSQNTTDKNSFRALKNLKRIYKITPEDLSGADVKEIEKAIRPAGLYRQKARVIKELAVSLTNGKLNKILDMDGESARNLLKSLKGVGPKTADVVLLMTTNYPTFPIDTHVMRVSKRLGLVPEDADYEEARKSLMKFFRPEDYLKAHLLLIKLGRTYCRARKPKCDSCPLSDMCPKLGVNYEENTSS